jgi:hypothetical protein
MAALNFIAGALAEFDANQSCCQVAQRTLTSERS